MGGRSRVAAQMLSGKGFDKVYNLSGGFKAWNGETAFGTEEQGLELLTGAVSPEETLMVAYSLEMGLRDFYLSMIPKIKNKAAQNIFQKLSEIEIKHQDRIFKEYVQLSEKPVNREEFEKDMVQAMEGGLTTEEYIDHFQPNFDYVPDIIELAMSIEAQALDLYLRSADKSFDPGTQKVLVKIAKEERAHLKQLGTLMETIVVAGH